MMKCAIRSVFFASSLLATAAAAESDDIVAQATAECREIGDKHWQEPVAREGYQDAKRLKWYRPHYPINSPPKLFVCVVVRFDIDEKGRTENVEDLGRRPADAPYGFYLKAREAILKWKYAPALMHGRPVRREDMVQMVSYGSYRLWGEEP